MGMYFSISALVILLIFAYMFFSKKRVRNIETIVYAYLLVLTICGIALDIITAIMYNSGVDTGTFAYRFGSRLVFEYLILWLVLFSFYMKAISHPNDEHKEEQLKKQKRISIIVYTIAFVLILLLPLQHNMKNNVVIPTGLSVGLTYGLALIIIIYDIFLAIKNRKTIVTNKVKPLYAFVLLMIVNFFIQAMFPELFLVNYVIALVIMIMYFTIENPDVKMIEQLELAKDQADKANRAKTDFLSSMSHEIRTPLNAIVGFSDYIITSSNLDEAKENAKDIVNASQTLLEIVNGILDISKIEAGKLEIVNVKYPAKTSFESLAKLITPKMQEKGLDFTYYIAPDIPETLFGDHANIKKVVTNLLSNAYKYTDKGFVRYEVNCINSADTTKLIITVEDSGRGIKQESVDKLFTKFQRLDEDRNTTIEGTGLGLAITKQLIELMGGKILVHTVYGEGSKFTVMLTQRIETTPVTIKEKEVKTTLDLRGKKILIVDDNALNIKVANKILERFNADNVESLDSGFACLDKINAGNIYDIILMDDMMPKMSGVETFQKLKAIPGFDQPVVILTANAITGMKEKYLKEGFDDYLAKPIEKEELIRVCNEIFDKNSEKPALVHPEESTEAEVIEILETTEELPVITEEIASQNTKTPEDYLKENNVDVSEALEFLGDMEMYNMTMADFLSEVETKWQRIISYKDSNDMANYAIEVHSLKSDAKYLGFMFLADVAYEHELKSKENDSTFVNSNFTRLEEVYSKALAIAKTYKEMTN